MSANMNLFLRVNYVGGALAAGLSSAGRQVRQFATGAEGALRRVQAQARALSGALNGFGTVTKMAMAYGGYSASGVLQDALKANLEFERRMLETKQLAEMTAEQISALRKEAISGSRESLQTPLDIADGLRTLANAGMRYEAIAPTIQEAARSALAFRSTVQDIANMDFDIQEKFRVDPKAMRDVHNMLYYHSKSGRFEAKSLASEAPVYLSEMSKLGMGGVEGLNFAGALTQVMMKLAPATQPTEVSTLIKHGLGHITQPHYVKGLEKFGIDVKKYAPGGKFYGEGGIDGLMDLAAAMKAKGLTDPFKMGEAGFREQYTQNFWRQLMTYSEEIRAQMKTARSEAAMDRIGVDNAEIKQAAFGKMRAAEIEAQKVKLGESAAAAAGGFAGAMEWAADNKMAAGLGALGALIGGRLAYKAGMNRRGGDGMAGLAAGAVGGVQRVFVVNLPGAGGLRTSADQARRSGSGPVTVPAGPAAGAGAGRLGGMAAGAAGALKYGAPVALAMGAWDAYQVSQEKELTDGQRVNAYVGVGGRTAGALGGAALGGAVGALFGGVGAVPGAMIGGALGDVIGGKIAEWLSKDNLRVKVDVDVKNGNIVAAVNEANSREARRN